MNRTYSVSDVSLKLVVLGDSAVGKTSLVHRYVVREVKANPRTTVGVDLHSKKDRIDGVSVDLKIWDTAGQERYRAVSHTYYREAAAALLVFDLTSEKSFSNIKDYWLPEALALGSRGLVFVLVGNKADRPDKRVVTSESIRSLCKEKSIQYLETSAFTGEGVDKTFETLVSLALQQRITPPAQPSGTGGTIHLADDNTSPVPLKPGTIKLQAGTSKLQIRKSACCKS